MCLMSMRFDESVHVFNLVMYSKFSDGVRSECCLCKLSKMGTDFFSLHRCNCIHSDGKGTIIMETCAARVSSGQLENPWHFKGGKRTKKI